MRLVIAECRVDYAGRLTAHLPMARRLILVKADGSVSIHADDRAYKPLNWMSPPCTLAERPPDEMEAAAGLSEIWEVRGRDGDTLQISLAAVEHDSSHELGVDPGLVKDGVEAHLQALLAEHPETLGDGWSLVRREYPTAIGPVDLLRRDPLLGDVQGVFAAQQIKPQARVLALDRGIACVTVDYDALRGMDSVEDRLF